MNGVAEHVAEAVGNPRLAVIGRTVVVRHAGDSLSFGAAPPAGRHRARARIVRCRVADVRITEFTDPGCPWAYSAEPIRRRLDWLYGDQVEWDIRMVVLSDLLRRIWSTVSRPKSKRSPTG